MGIRIHCKICEIFIKEAVGDDIQKLTGTEVCQECNTRVKKKMGDFDKLYAKNVEDINKLAKEADTYYKTIEQDRLKYVNNLKGLYPRFPKGSFNALT